MSTPVLINLDFNGNQILNVLVQVLASDPGSPAEGQIWYNSTTETFKFRANGTTKVLGRLDQISAPTGSVAMNSQKITGLLDPTSAQDAATKAYVDAFVNGLNWKDSVRAASTVNVVIATALENGDSAGGVTLATGDRFAVLNNSAPAENGIYVVQASGAAVRATDADSAAEIRQAAFFVEEGTNADTAWICTTDAPITLNTTGLTFAQFGAGATYTAGEGIDVTGTVISLDVPVSVDNGGTGATDIDGAKASLGYTGKFQTDVGDNSATSFNIDHFLGTKDVLVQVYRQSDGVEVICDVTRSTTNRVVLGFAVAPTTDQYRCVVVG